MTSMKKKISIIAFIIWVIGMLAFIFIPNTVLEETTTTTETTTECTTTETTTEPEETTTTEVTAKAQVNVREKAAIRNTDETTKKPVPETTKKVVETTTRKVETTTKKVEVISSKNTYTSADTYLLAQIIQAEAGICNRDEMAKVGQVVLNRVKTTHEDFDDCNTIREVLYQKGQYHSQTLKNIENGIVPSEEALSVAKGLIKGTEDSGLSENVLWQTGFVPTWRAKVVCHTKWHYYSEPI